MNTSRRAERSGRMHPARDLTLAALYLSIALGCGAENRPTLEPLTPTRASGIATPPLKVGDALPSLQAEGWLNGAPPALGAPGVRLIVVDVWGIWCPYCARSAPGLVRVYEKYSVRGVAFVSLTNSDLKVVESFVRHHSIPWPNGYGATVQTVAALGAGSGMTGPGEYEVAPTLYLVGTDGRVRWIDGRGRERHQEPKEWERVVDGAIAETLASTSTKP